MIELTQSRLKELLHYDPETGVFTWIVGNKSGKTADAPHPKGYLQIRVDGKLYYSHRLAWLYVKGVFTGGEIDHRFRVRTDNRIENLRECSSSQNKYNSGIMKTNKSGFKGVCWDKRDKKWRANIKVNGKFKSLGYFNCPIEASKRYIAKARELHGEFYREVA